MTNPAAGWYPDPAPESAPGRQRYWDGGQWTEHVHDPAPAYPAQQPQAPAYPQASPSYPQASAQPYGVPGTPATTPDGVPLAGWWWRVLARVLDGIFVIPLNILAATPVVASQWDSIHQWYDDLTYAADHNLPDPPTPAIFDFTSGPGITLLLCLVAASILYETVFLFWKQATPGKLVVGLRVRRRETPDLPAGSIFARVGFVLLGQFCVVLLLLDYLWPLWDDKKQALHDKVARTNVVRPVKDAVTVPGLPTEASPPPRW